MLGSTSNSIEFEYAPNGDIFDYILASPFDSKIARYYTIQLVNVLDYLH